MKSTQVTFLAELAAVIGCIVIGYLVAHRPPSGSADPKSQALPETRPLAKSTPEIPPPLTKAALADTTPVAAGDTAPQKTAQTNVAPTDPPIVINGYEVQDPLARIALSEVGSDPVAEVYWMGAINDPTLPAEERKDLIEDLNEDGLSDSQHPTAQDLPVIMRRLQLIDQLAPNAMDDVDRDAFGEAYKDLVGLLNGQEPK
jgi:hypothetical protein